MDIFGYHLDIVLVDAAVIVAAILALVAIQVALRDWRKRAVKAVQALQAEADRLKAKAASHEQDAQMSSFASTAKTALGWIVGIAVGILVPPAGPVAANAIRNMGELAGGDDRLSATGSRFASVAAQEAAEREETRARLLASRVFKTLRIISIASIIIVLIPIGGAIYNLLWGSPNLALRYNLYGLVAVAATGIGNLLLYKVLIPAAQQGFTAFIQSFGEGIGKKAGSAAAAAVNARVYTSNKDNA